MGHSWPRRILRHDDGKHFYAHNVSSPPLARQRQRTRHSSDMAAADPRAELLEEATCSICRELYTDPVTLDCGHSFCLSCLTRFKASEDLEKSCPECRQKFNLEKELKPSKGLANVAEMVKRLQIAPGGQVKGSLCAEHGERLQLFCETDGGLLCVVCRESRAHKYHRVSPMKEAEQEHKGVPGDCLNPNLKEDDVPQKKTERKIQGVPGDCLDPNLKEDDVPQKKMERKNQGVPGDYLDPNLKEDDVPQKKMGRKNQGVPDDCLDPNLKEDDVPQKKTERKKQGVLGDCLDPNLKEDDVPQKKTERKNQVSVDVWV
ncbi:hypothetical protein NDU88_004577 [Pleurodeles waltl]|uniref:Uncharacterized protein n=1 Tax=Pleurodeles waltl TaxID=8319 RepID=A0AAV7V3U5_PLEWA|nr:hypothetical protein NDU88_004577 [Pleurodeles waltl]